MRTETSSSEGARLFIFSWNSQLCPMQMLPRYPLTAVIFAPRLQTNWTRARNFNGPGPWHGGSCPLQVGAHTWMRQKNQYCMAESHVTHPICTWPFLNLDSCQNFVCIYSEGPIDINICSYNTAITIRLLLYVAIMTLTPQLQKTWSCPDSCYHSPLPRHS